EAPLVVHVRTTDVGPAPCVTRSGLRGLGSWLRGRLRLSRRRLGCWLRLGGNRRLLRATLRLRGSRFLLGATLGLGLAGGLRLRLTLGLLRSFALGLLLGLLLRLLRLALGFLLLGLLPGLILGLDPLSLGDGCF